jgi:hypothetical protein
MEINTNNPVSNGVRESGDVKKISAVKQDNHPRPDQQAAQAEENPDYRISLSDKSKTSASRMAGAQTTGQPEGKADLSEDEAARMAQKTSEQLAQTNSAISNQAVQQAVDLFT